MKILIMPHKFKIAVVCSSNQNRSMEAHAFLSKKGFNVSSFGSGNQVKLPGSAPDKPNIYEFGTSYESMYQELMSRDPSLYTQNGILHMLDRNRRLKSSPERFQDCPESFDVIFTVEERVYDQVIEYFESREVIENIPVHVINMDVQDNHEEATIGALLIHELVQKMADSEDLDNDIDDLLQDFETKNQRTILHTVQFY